LQKRVGAEVDYFWGPKSNAACQRYVKSFMPKVSPWPKPDDASMTAFYGKAGDESNLVNLDVAFLDMRYGGKKIKTLRCHRKVADSLLIALKEIATGPAAWVLQEYGGCFNFRPMRGGSRPSKHSWGAAIDLAPGSNGLHTYWPTKATMPIEVMIAFARQGWVGLGWQINRDAMHFEAVSR
jgi:hypothetical protein